MERKAMIPICKFADISEHDMDMLFLEEFVVSKDFLNINARVNWDASRNFAIGGTVLLYTIQPLIDKLLKKISIKTKYIIVLVIGIPMLLDLILHTILKLF